MLEINKINAKTWSRMGSRATYGQALLALAEVDKELLVLSSDLGSSSGLSRFETAFPERFLNVGIAEQNMIGIASGLAKEGFTVFASSFAPFISMRASEQIRMNLGYMDLNVKAVAIGSGVSMAFLGNSHYGIEDASIMRSIPNLTVVSPADCVEIIKVIHAAAKFDGPMYIRLTGAVNNPPVYFEDYEFEIGKAIKLKQGSDVSIIACGTMVYESLEASKILELNGISTSVINMHTLKPLDTKTIDECLDSTKLIVTVEEQTIIGGLGGAVAEYKSAFKNVPPQCILGLPDIFGVTAEYRFLLEKYRLVGDKIAIDIQKFLQKKSK
jgi:transketolase